MPNFELHEIFCENIKRRRKELGLTQVEVAKKLGVAQPTYADYENGRYEPTLGVIQRVAAALEITPADLLTPHMAHA